VVVRGLDGPLEVRTAIYKILFDVANRNPELTNDILDILAEHAARHGWINVPEDQREELLDLHDLLGVEDHWPVVKEPIGWFVICCQLLISKADQLYNESEDLLSDADSSSKRKLEELLQDLLNKYAKADFLMLDFVKDAEYSKFTVEGTRNSLKVDLILNLLESLMNFSFSNGADISEDMADKLVKLFRLHQEVFALKVTESDCCFESLKVTFPLELICDQAKDGRKKEKGGKGPELECFSSQSYQETSQ